MQKFFYFFAVPGTLILVLQSLGSIFGLFGDEDFDFDDSDTGDFETEGIRFFSIRGIFAFIAIFGWTGVLMAENEGNIVTALFVSTLAGFIAMTVIGYIFYGVSKLQSKGNLDFNNAIGKTAEVYLTIPPSGEGEGKVNVLIQERYAEIKAITIGNRALKTGSMVRITDMNSNVATVEQIGKD